MWRGDSEEREGQARKPSERQIKGPTIRRTRGVMNMNEPISGEH